MFKMELELRLGEKYREADLLSAGFRRKKRLNGEGFPEGTFRHENDKNEIYIVQEQGGGRMHLLAYYNLETGETRRHFGK